MTTHLPLVDWNQIDTVLLDMDGTLLDLHFDNYFWLEHLPKRYAEIHHVDFATATQHLMKNINQYEGTLQWYCLEFWSAQLDVDIRSLKAEIKHKIQIRPHVKEFLTRLRQQHKKCLLVTNAHPQSLSLKLEVTEIDKDLDIIISAHEFNQPKEAQEFWHALCEREHFDRARTLFIDDTVRILESAQKFGIRHLIGIHQPDSQIARTLEGFPAIRHFDEIMPPANPARKKNVWLTLIWKLKSASINGYGLHVFLKTRTLAKQAIDGGKVHCDNQRVKSAKEISVGITLSIRQDMDVKIVTVTMLSDQRRGSPEAMLLYEETAASKTLREKRSAERKAELDSFLARNDKPDKKERRQIHRFQRMNSLDTNHQ